MTDGSVSLVTIATHSNSPKTRSFSFHEKEIIRVHFVRTS